MPFVALDFWWIRVFDYPHLQLTFLTLAAFLIYFIKFDIRYYVDYIFVGVLGLCLIFQVSKIYPYTEFADYEVLNSSEDSTAFSLYTCNVLQHNKEYHFLNEQISEFNPDIMLFTETNKTWIKHIKDSLSSDYTYSVDVPWNNSYGMMLLSKFELFDTEIKYLVSDSIPSIHTKIKLNTKDTLQIYAIHPTPPMPQENAMSSDRDTEMMMIAKMALDSKYPVIVVGDFNDVAWSETSILFQNVSRLLDVRKGRGLYNTFSADSYIMRWPLDHIFISSHFRLKSVRKCKDVGSDHYPLFTELSYEPEKKNLQLQAYPSDEDLKNAENQIKTFKEKNKLKK